MGPVFILRSEIPGSDSGQETPNLLLPIASGRDTQPRMIIKMTAKGDH
ncbi:hypothetical protein ES703_89295 [subsurface metagenome]